MRWEVAETKKQKEHPPCEKRKAERSTQNYKKRPDFWRKNEGEGMVEWDRLNLGVVGSSQKVKIRGRKKKSRMAARVKRSLVDQGRGRLEVASGEDIAP